MPARRRAQAWRHHPAYRRPSHIHDEAEVNLVLRGRATFRLGANEHEVCAGSVLWFPPGLDHYLVHADADFDLFVVGYSPALLAALAREHGASPTFARPLGRVPVSVLESWQELLAQAPQSVDGHGVEARLLHLLEQLVAFDSGSNGDAPSRELGYRAARALLGSPTATRDQLARRLSSNRGDVSRSFRKQQGISLCEYKNRLRILEFLRRIEAGRETLTRAALAAGFGSYANCHRVFRAVLGASPGDFQRPGLRVALANRFEPLETSTGAAANSPP